MYASFREYPLSVEIRPADIDGAAGAKHLFARLITKLRADWPSTNIILRADSDFCTGDLLAYCDSVNARDGLGSGRRPPA
jgi:hypothetical protein